METVEERVLKVLIGTSPERPLSAPQIAERAQCSEKQAEDAIYAIRARAIANIKTVNYYCNAPSTPSRYD